MGLPPFQRACRALRRPLLLGAALAAVSGLPTASGLAAGLPTASGAAAAPIKLRCRLQAGDRFTYLASFDGRVTIDATGSKSIPPIAIGGTIRNRRTVMNALPDGEFTLADELLGGEFSANVDGVSRTSPVAATAPQLSTINALGRMVFSAEEKSQLAAMRSKFGFDPSEIIAPLTMLQAFPEQAVQPGSHWRRSSGVSLPSALAGSGSNFSFKVLIDSRLERLNRVRGVSTAEVVSQTRMPIQLGFSQNGNSLKVGGGLNGTVQTDFSIATGMAVQSKGSLHGTILLQASGNSLAAAKGLGAGRLNVDLTFSLRMVGAKRGVDRRSLVALIKASRRSGSHGGLFSTRGLFSAGAARTGGGPTLSRTAYSTRAVPNRAASGIGGGRSTVLAASAAPPQEEPPARLWVPANRGVVGSDVTVQAILSGAPSGASKPGSYVTFLVNGEHAFTTNTAPYRFEWDTSTLPAGVYALGLELYGSSGELLYHSPSQRVRVGSSPARG